MGILWRSRKQPVAMAPETCFSDGRRVADVVAALVPGDISEAKILNHHGLLSLKVVAGGRPLKVAECTCEYRAQLAEEALKLVAASGGPVPAFLGRSGTVIIAEWVEGRLCRDEPPARQQEILLSCQVALSRTVIPEHLTSECHPIHLNQLAERLRVNGRRVLSRERIERILDGLWQRLPAAEGCCIIHPDLTPVNVVVSDRGPVIIDNEVIGIGVGREFDVWHSAESLYGYRDQAGMARYARDYDKQCPTPTLFASQALWDDFRQLRRGLKAIEKGRLIKASRLLRGLPVG